jgi:hypothetical protein
MTMNQRRRNRRRNQRRNQRRRIEGIGIGGAGGIGGGKL